MLKIKLIETNNFIDLNNNLSNNEYSKIVTLFGITIFKYYYKLDVTLPEKDTNVIRGFQIDVDDE